MSLLLSPWQSIYLLPTNNKKTKTRNHTKLSWTIFLQYFIIKTFYMFCLRAFLDTYFIIVFSLQLTLCFSVVNCVYNRTQPLSWGDNAVVEHMEVTGFHSPASQK